MNHVTHQVCRILRPQCVASATTLLATLALAALVSTAAAQNPPNGGSPDSGSSAILTPWTAPDNSASAGIPSGWKAEGSESTITLAGPQNEDIFLGRVYIARNGPFQAGQRGANGADLMMPYGAPLTQKLIMIYAQGYALGGKPAPQITFTSATPIQVPPILGQCGRFVADLNAGQEQDKIMGIFCSFPADWTGAFKNFIMVAQAPADIAAQDAPIAQAVFASYRVPVPWLARKIAPVTAPPPAASGGGGMSPGGGAGLNSSLIGGMRSADIMATCMSDGVLRQYGPRQLPQECGGEAPNP
jgi:hypothetical protein